MTKQQALKQFREMLRECEIDFRGDSIAKREAWDNYTDSLCKAGVITENQYKNWSNLF